MKTGYDVIIMAGQSNAVGFGFGETDTPFTESPDIIELSDTYKMKFVQDENGNSKLDLVFPPKENQLYLGIAKEMDAYDRKNASLANSFAAEYIKAGLLKPGRKLLIVKTSVGGTGFTKKYWTEGGVCRERMFYMVDKALELSDDMKITAFLWHQGEHDAFEAPERTYGERKAFYKAELKNLLSDVREHYAKHSFPIIAGEFVREWMEENKVACDAVLCATRELFSEIGNAELVSSEGLLSNGKKNSTGDNLHFCRDALMEFGRRYFKAYRKLI